MARFWKKKTEQQGEPAVLTSSLSGIREWIKQYKPSLLPCLSENQVLEFEQVNSVKLPKEYREFVTTVCEGGAFGPEYGLRPLDPLSRNYACCDRALCGYRVAKPFPFTEEWVWEDEKQTEDRERLIKEATNGTLVLGEEGCGAYWALVVTGPCRGEVWLMTAEGITPCKPRMRFGQWLDTLARGGISWWAQFVMHWGPRDGIWFYSHAAKKMESKEGSATSGITQSQPLCRDCIEFFRKSAAYLKKDRIVVDPYVVRVFHPSGKVDVSSV